MNEVKTSEALALLKLFQPFMLRGVVWRIHVTVSSLRGQKMFLVTYLPSARRINARRVLRGVASAPLLGRRRKARCSSLRLTRHGIGKEARIQCLIVLCPVMAFEICIQEHMPSSRVRDSLDTTDEYC